MAPHSKKAIEVVLSDIELDLQSESAERLELAIDRQIRRNASQVGEQFHVTRHCRDSGCTQRGTRVVCCGGVRNSSRTCIREPWTAVWAGTLNSWMMRKSFRFASIALNRRGFGGPGGFRAPSSGLARFRPRSSCIGFVGVAERHGWHVVATYEDAGISGAKGRDKRPGFDRLMIAVVRREIDMIAA
jgi:hypothetical protein